MKQVVDGFKAPIMIFQKGGNDAWAVAPDGSNKIYLKNLFFDERPTDGTRPGNQVSILYHEMTHLYAATTYGDQIGRGNVYLTGETAATFPDRPLFHGLDTPGNFRPATTDLINLAAAYEGFLENYYT